MSECYSEKLDEILENKKKEIDTIYNRKLEKKIIEKDIKLHFIGDLNKLPFKLQKVIKKSVIFIFKILTFILCKM